MRTTIRGLVLSTLAVATMLSAPAGAQTARPDGKANPAGDATGAMTGKPEGVQQPMTGGGPAEAAASARTDARGGSLSMHHTDRRFLTRAYADGLAEIASGKLAQQRAESDAVRQFAQRMVEEHTKANEQIRRFAKEKGAVLTDEPDPAARAKLASVEKLSGAAFDRAYLNGQIRDHRGTIQRFEGQVRGGRDENLKKFAADTLPSLRQHLEQAQQLSEQIKKPSR